MSRYQSSRKVLIGIALSLTLLLFLSFASSMAQGATEINYGTVTTGTIGDPNTPQTYSFSGTVGDLVSIRVIGLSPTSDPNVQLLDPSANVLASNDNRLDEISSTDASVVYRLPATGQYTIIVGGTAGDYLLNLTGSAMPNFTVLELNTPVQVQVPLSDQAQVFTFNTDPLAGTTLLIEAEPFDLDALVGIRSSMGETVALFQGNLDNACVSLSPGDELHEVRVLSDPDLTGTITLTLGRGPCELGDVPEPVQPPQAPVTPVGIEGKCAAWSPNNINVRTGPGLQFPILTVKFAQQAVEVLGQSSDGSWLFVQTPTTQGWLASSLIILVGPCSSIVVVPPPPTPLATATQGMPISTPEGTAEATDEATPEVTPEITPELTPETTQTP